MTKPEESGTVDLDRIAHAVREILIAVGEDPDRDGLVKTPERVARMYEEIFAGLREDPAQPHGDVRGESRRDGDGPGHPAVFSV